MVPLWPDFMQLLKVPRETGNNQYARIILHNMVYNYLKSHLLKVLNKLTFFSFIINLFLYLVFILPYYVCIMPRKIHSLWLTRHKHL